MGDGTKIKMPDKEKIFKKTSSLPSIFQNVFKQRKVAALIPPVIPPISLPSSLPYLSRQPSYSIRATSAVIWER